MSANENAYRAKMTDAGLRFELVTESSAPRRREDPIVMPMRAPADDTLGRIDQALKNDTLGRIDQVLEGDILRRINRALSR